jgi:hypothetical protein
LFQLKKRNVNGRGTRTPRAVYMKNKYVKNGAVCYTMTVYSWRPVMTDSAGWKQQLTELKIKWLGERESQLCMYLCVAIEQNRES